MKSTLLLSACCAPCATVAIEQLSKNYNVTIHFWGNNIHPIGEYEKRREAVVILSNAKNLSLITDAYKPTQPDSCEQCFELRLRTTADFINNHNFDFFATSLTTSPHKDAGSINQIGAAISEKYLPTNFKKNDGFARSVTLSKQLGLYRQNYCGCHRSLDIRKT